MLETYCGEFTVRDMGAAYRAERLGDAYACNLAPQTAHVRRYGGAARRGMSRQARLELLARTSSYVPDKGYAIIYMIERKVAASAGKIHWVPVYVGQTRSSVRSRLARHLKTKGGPVRNLARSVSYDHIAATDVAVVPIASVNESESEWMGRLGTAESYTGLNKRPAPGSHFHRHVDLLAAPWPLRDRRLRYSICTHVMLDKATETLNAICGDGDTQIFYTRSEANRLRDEQETRIRMVYEKQSGIAP